MKKESEKRQTINKRTLRMIVTSQQQYWNPEHSETSSKG